MLSFTHHNQIPGVALAPQVATGAPINGPAIMRPSRLASSILFLFMAGAFDADDVLVFNVEEQDATTDAWTTIKDKDGAALVIDPVDLSDGGGLENGALQGLLPVRFLQENTKAVRVVLASVAGASENVVVAVGYFLVDLHDQMSEQKDVFIEKLMAK